MGEGFESVFFGLGAVSPPALTPRVKRVTRLVSPPNWSVSPPGALAPGGATVGSGGATAGITRRKEKNFSSFLLFSFFPQDHNLYFNGSF